MLIKMKESQNGSPNGLIVNLYEKGVQYDVPESLGDVFVKIGAAEKVVKPEIKNISEAPENKDAGEAPTNKGFRGRKDKES